MSIQQCLYSNVYAFFSGPVAFGVLLKQLQTRTTRSHFFYYDEHQNGKSYPFANVIYFCHLRGQIQSKLFYRLLVTYKLQVHIFAASNGKKFSTRSNGKKFQICKWKYFVISTFVITEEMPLAKTWPVISHSLKIWTYERLYTLWEETD